jgi:glutathione peroxidase
MSNLDLSIRTNEGVDLGLTEFKEKNIIIVNTASKCGFTKQYAELQEISKLENIQVIAFPCNQFGAQEPGTDEEIKEFCTTNYDVDFIVALKCEVNGENAHPLYKKLKELAKNSEDIGWNFEKFLIKPDGEVLHFGSQVTPKEIIASL